MSGKRPLIPRVDATEAAASVADIGVLFPILAALVLVNGVDAAAAMIFAGALFVLAALVYRVPVPVQPIKAAAAIAIATGASPRVIAAAGLVLGAILVLLAATGLIRAAARLFPKPIIRGNQLGVGLLLVAAAYRLLEGRTALVAAVLLTVAVMGAGRSRGAVAVVMVGGGIAWSVANGATVSVGPALAAPAFALPGASELWTALVLLVIPQIPLTLGNAVIGTADLEREYYGERARRVTPAALCLTCGAANIGLGLFGGMPLCHGSSGATAYYRFGARTGGVGLVVGAALLAGGFAFAPAVVSMFGAIPAPVLAALLAYTGLRHALLVSDLRGAPLAVAGAMGLVGGLTRNLMLGMAVGLPAMAAWSALRWARARRGAVAA